jgi:hypothetical protein
MSTHDFLPDDVFHDLPSDPGEKFLALYDIATERYKKEIEGKREETKDSITIAYMAQISVIARELGLGTIPRAMTSPVIEGEWQNFRSAISAIKTKHRLRASATIDSSSVSLGRVTKFRIEQEIERLRQLISDADLPEKKKKSLYSKLDELVEELHRQRLSFAKLAAVAAAIAGVLGGSTATLANGPEAIEVIGRILHWVGEEKAAEDEEQLLLSGPPKALPPPAEEP